MSSCYFATLSKVCAACVCELVVTLVLMLTRHVILNYSRPLISYLTKLGHGRNKKVGFSGLSFFYHSQLPNGNYNRNRKGFELETPNWLLWPCSVHKNKLTYVQKWHSLIPLLSVSPPLPPTNAFSYFTPYYLK